jgi:hypothetical protein
LGESARLDRAYQEESVGDNRGRGLRRGLRRAQVNDSPATFARIFVAETIRAVLSALPNLAFGILLTGATPPVDAKVCPAQGIRPRMDRLLDLPWFRRRWKWVGLIKGIT